MRGRVSKRGVTCAKLKPSSATKAKAAASKGPAANKRAAAKPKAHAKGITPTKGRRHAETAPYKGRLPVKSKAKKTTRGIQKNDPAARVASAKPVAAKAPAAPGLRRNTTLQTRRGTQVAGGLRPKSRTTGAALAEAANSAARNPSPTQSVVPPAASAGASAGSKRKGQAAAATPGNKSKGKTRSKGRSNANTAPTKGRLPAKSKAKKTTRGIQKKNPPARVASAKPVAPKALAAAGLRRNKTLQTRGKQAAAKKPSPTQSVVPPVASAPAASAGAAAGSKRKVQAETAAPANKCAKNTLASHCAPSAPTAAASAAQPKSKERPSPPPSPHSPHPSPPPPLGGAAAGTAASGKTNHVGPRQDKGRAPIAQRDNGPACGSKSPQGAGAGASSKPAYGFGSAQEAGVVASLQTSLITDEIKQYHHYSQQGSRGLLRFVCAGDRREKVRPASSLFVDDALSAHVFLVAL